jgi:hypothetical protein
MPEKSVETVKYDAEKKVLSITFSNGYRTNYSGVPNDVYENLLSSSNKDDYFKGHIEANYWYNDG